MWQSWHVTPRAAAGLFLNSLSMRTPASAMTSWQVAQKPGVVSSKKRSAALWMPRPGSSAEVTTRYSSGAARTRSSSSLPDGP